MSSKKSDRSFYSKNGINNIILGMAEILKEYNNNEFDIEIKVPSNDEIYRFLKEKNLIPANLVTYKNVESVETDVETDIENKVTDVKEICNAMKKNKKERCNNPIKNFENGFCGYHTNHPPDVTWNEFNNFTKEPTNQEINLMSKLNTKEKVIKEKIKESRKFIEENSHSIVKQYEINEKISIIDDYVEETDDFAIE